ncbi:endonuclease/exonuclease/phosphatase family protein [Alicyclobacillus kakegawensis]|uniref:endonuclease/exonuclease/phosphatase family protein n=1 Tax=Alicyclobacillus kakegawensis TaxID=392012 RepID=UPI0008375CBB|nr:endonuclease/exonuclease/phosphatase family protein [Alicyclobacillus kakegawensis]
MHWSKLSRSILTAAGLCLAVAMAPSPARAAELPPQPTAEKGTLTVVSYNTHGGIGIDGRYSLARIADVIAQTHADVVGLQEVGAYWHKHARHEDEAQFYIRRLHMYGFFAPIFNLDAITPGGPRRQYGVLLLSRYPIQGMVNHQIARRLTQGRRESVAVKPGFAEAMIHVHGQDLRVYLTHLDYRRDAHLRARQVADMMRIVSENTGPKVLMGDLNAVPSAPELRPLWNVFGQTMNRCQGGCATFPADAPTRLIDYVLVSHGLQVQSVQVVNTTASDHRPIRAVISLAGSEHRRAVPAPASKRTLTCSILEGVTCIMQVNRNETTLGGTGCSPGHCRSPVRIHLHRGG